MMLNEANFRKQVLSCWLGKNAGGILGTPTEGYPGILDFTYYEPVPTEPVPNDDLELQVMNAVALFEMDTPVISRAVIGDIWMKHMDFHCDEYAVALKNLHCGIRPPWSGRFDNYYINGMGSAIRSELWACLAPGNPELAAAFAREDACVDHDGDGVDAEVFLAAMESRAFISSDLEDLIECGLSFLPEESQLKECICETRRLWHEEKDWKTVRNHIQERYASEFRTAVIPNVPYTVLALLSGERDFGKTICTAVNCGMDTDCSAATAGAILGIIAPDCIDEKWLAPIGNALVVRDSCIRNMSFPATIEDFTDLVIALEKRIPKTLPVIEDSPEPDYSNWMITGEYAVIDNLTWYFVPTNGVDWQPFTCNPVYSSLSLPEYKYGQQVLLRFQFNLPEDGTYSLMFNSPTSNQVYLDPDRKLECLHDSRHMLFGRMRTFPQQHSESFLPVGDHAVIFSPTLGGAPLNQIKRYLQLQKGEHEVMIALEPLPYEREIYWGMGVGDSHARFINCFVGSKETW